MKNEWHIFSNGFMAWAREEFPEPLSSHFTFDLLENIINYIANRSETAVEFVTMMKMIIDENNIS